MIEICSSEYLKDIEDDVDGYFDLAFYGTSGAEVYASYTSVKDAEKTVEMPFVIGFDNMIAVRYGISYFDADGVLVVHDDGPAGDSSTEYIVEIPDITKISLPHSEIRQTISKKLRRLFLLAARKGYKNVVIDTVQAEKLGHNAAAMSRYLHELLFGPYQFSEFFDNVIMLVSKNERELDEIEDIFGFDINFGLPGDDKTGVTSIADSDKLMMQMIQFDKGDAKRIQHFMKVYEFARLISIQEGLSQSERRILEAAAILHDIAIIPCEEQYGECSGKLQEAHGPRFARELLEKHGEYTNEETERICYLIAHHHTYDNIDKLDYQILVEADFLVNALEDGLEKSAIKSVKEKVFKTKTGSRLLESLYL